MLGKKKNNENDPKEQVGELKDEPKSSAKDKKKPKVSKGFGNTIILFIVFFIVFTVIVTGVAFFADKIDLSGGKEKNLEDIVPAEKMTDPKDGEATEYVMDEKGNVDKKKPEEMKVEDLKIPAAAPIPQAKMTETKPAPLPPVNIKPEIKKPAPKKKPAAKKPAPKKPVAKKKAADSGLGMLSKKVTTGPYVVQVASFKNRSYAEKEVSRLKRVATDVFITKVDLGEKGIWFRVRCYNGVSYAEARAKATSIAAKTSHKPYPMKK